MTVQNQSIKIDIPDTPKWTGRVKEKAFTNAISYGSCTQSILSAFMDEFGIDNPMLIRSAGVTGQRCPHSIQACFDESPR